MAIKVHNLGSDYVARDNMNAPKTKHVDNPVTTVLQSGTTETQGSKPVDSPEKPKDDYQEEKTPKKKKRTASED